jgi:hypothetical protein
MILSKPSGIMPPPERRRIEELTNLYRLEPTLRDIYVEGPCDRSLIDWFLHEKGVRTATVTEIDFVEIPPHLVVGADLDDNNKNRLVVLAREVQRQLGPIPSLTCLVDSDFDRILGIKESAALLVSTDHACMEMYFYDARSMNKFLKLVVRGFHKTAAEVLLELRGTLQELFLIRVANHLLGWDLRLTQFERLCALTADGIAFNRPEYIRRVLLANARARQLEEFVDRIEICRRRLTADPRDQIHGHDFVALLAWYVRAHGKHRINRETVENSLPACTESDWLSEAEMFKTLLARALG